MTKGLKVAWKIEGWFVNERGCQPVIMSGRRDRRSDACNYGRLSFQQHHEIE